MILYEVRNFKYANITIASNMAAIKHCIKFTGFTNSLSDMHKHVANYAIGTFINIMLHRRFSLHGDIQYII